MTDLVTLVRVKAVESGGERWIEGYATTSQEDRVGDVVEPRGAKFSLPIPLLFQHMHHEPIGAVTQATVSDKGIRIRARLSSGVARAEEIWTLIKDGVLTAVSIGFRVLDQKPHGNRGSRITSWEWLETSVVSVPANPGALISVAKCMAMDIKQLGSPAQLVTARAKAGTAWMKGIATKDGIDADFIWDHATESAKKWAAEKFRESPKMFPQLAGLFAKLGLEVSKSTLSRVIDLEKRIAALEENESDSKGRGLKFMGRWNRDVSYQKGDMTNFAGALWVASKATTETPGACTDWQKMLTADKRGGFNAGE